ncbi:hypothetical protein C2G38_2097999, partial [Gigaspora rosea]
KADPLFEVYCKNSDYRNSNHHVSIFILFILNFKVITWSEILFFYFSNSVIVHIQSTK